VRANLATTALKGRSDSVFRHSVLVNAIAALRTLRVEPPNGAEPMKAPMASSGDLTALRDRLVNMRAELIVGLARDELDSRGLPVLARIEGAIDALDRSPRRMVIIAPPGEPIRLAFYSKNDSTVATQIAIDCDKAGRVVATVDRWTDEPEGGETVSEQPEVESGTNEGGNPMASWGIALLDGLSQKRHARPKLSLAQARALVLLAATIEKAGEIPPANDYIPVNTQCVREDLWRSCCYAGQITKSDRPDAKRMAFTRAAERLVAVGRVGKREPWVWIREP
jgi:hypothetical protein